MGRAAPKTVSAVRPASLAFNDCGMRASCRLTQHPLLGRSMTFDNFPPYSIDLRDAHVESGILVIPAVVVLGGEENPGRYRLLAKLQLATPGKGCHTGMLRDYLADASCDSSVVHIRVPDYASTIGSGSNSCQVHGRFILLDNATDYRSQYQQKSFLLHIG